MDHRLECLCCGELIEDTYTLDHHDGALLRTKFPDGPLIPIEESRGVWRYRQWLPVTRASTQIAGTVSYQSESLADELGMSNLWITFHGYWPERGGMCPTTTFKDMEAVVTIQRLKDHSCDGLVCASAGNTARSFAFFGANAGYPTVIIVAERHLERLWLPDWMDDSSVMVFGIGDGADYNDAIEVSTSVAEQLGWQLEGGAKNVARRDGIGSLILDVAFKAGRLPDHYFQAIGGGPGPIGVHEMAVRAIGRGIFEGPPPRQHLSQNVEHHPIHKGWQDRRRDLRTDDMPNEDVEVFSDFLVNRAPAYAVKGGVFDLLQESDGQTWIIDRDAATSAATMFEAAEGIDILSPGAVALASLIRALDAGEVDHEDMVVLNISGGGQNRMFNEIQTKVIRPSLITSKELAPESIVDLVRNSLES